MKSDIQQFEEVLAKYKFPVPVPHDIRERAGVQVKPALQATLKRVHRYSFLTSAIIGVFFIARKFGLGFSMAQSTAVLVVAAAVTATAVSTGGYYTVKTVQEKLNPSIETPLQDDITKNSMEADGLKPITSPQNKPAILAGEVIVMESFSARGFDTAKVRDLNKSIKQELIKLRGSGRITTKARSKAMTLRGQLGTGSGSVHLFLRLVHPSGEIIHAGAYSASTYKALRAQAPAIAREISLKVK